MQPPSERAPAPTVHRGAGGQPRVLHVITRHTKDCGTASDLNLAMAWEVRNGYRVHLVVGDGGEICPLPDAVTVEKVGDLTRAIRPRSDLRALRCIRRIIRSFDPDVIHTHLSKPGILGRLAARGSGAVVVHNIHIASFGRGYSRPASVFFMASERLCGRLTDQFVTVSDELVDEYVAARVGRREQFLVIHTPIDIARFARARSVSIEERRDIRSTFALPRDVPVLLGCGLLEKRKRWDLFLTKVAPLLRDGEAVAVLAGVGPEEAALRALAQRLGIVDQLWLPGYVEDMVDLLAIASVVVLTSVTEGLPRVLLEGIAAGVPVVATDVQGAKELAEYRLMILPSNGSGLDDACRQLIRNPTAPTDLADLEAWTIPAVENQLALLHATLAHRRPA